MSQKSRILSHLKKRPITALQALRLYGTLRLAARICELRDQGWGVDTEWVTTGDKRIAKYRLGSI